MLMSNFTSVLENMASLLDKGQFLEFCFKDDFNLSDGDSSDEEGEGMNAYLGVQEL